jgi:ribosomal protein S18 acetylase RimI-like enzyme
MITGFSHLDFDSSLFGYKVGAASFADIDNEELRLFYNQIKEEQYRLFYCYPKDEKSAILLNTFGAKAVDHKCIYLKEKLISQTTNKLIKSYSKTKDHNFLSQLVLQSGVFSRFRIDTNFHNKEFEKLYSKWIEKSINKEIVDDIIVFLDNQVELGFLSYRIKDNICDLSLIAVDKSIRNKGIGRNLVKQLENICIQVGVDKIKVTTQLNNRAACCFYETNGFRLILVETVYHLWI